VLKLLVAVQPHCNANSLVAHAWGVNQKTISWWCQKLLQSNGSTVVRKQRSDAGKHSFDSESKRQSTCSPCFVFGKLLRQQNPDQSHSKKDVDAAWMAASPHTKEHCTRLAKEWIEQGPFLVEELQKALQSTQGSVSWELLATLVAGSGNLQLVGQRAIRKCVMALPESTCKSTEMPPKLDEANIQRRLWWPHQFWVLWKSGAHFEAVQVLLVHMDEKWLWSTAVRMHLK